ncbi:hypothetical protein HYV81_04420 [Candidatus Woesearchaeota archaeon]|nr:hypothetical protein [Candidatus Woesearchaeota archaeon]
MPSNSTVDTAILNAHRIRFPIPGGASYPMKKSIKQENSEVSNFILVRKFRETLGHMAAHKSYILLPGIFDMLFFLIYGFITAPIWIKILEHVQAIAYVAQDRHAEISELVPTKGIIGAFAGDPTGYYLRNFLLLLLILSLIAYFLYCFFQGIAWFIAKKQANKGLAFYKFLWQFFRINILWYILFLLYYGTNIVYGYIAQRALRLNQPSSAALVYWSLFVYLIVLSYFAFISYGLLGKYRDWGTYRSSFSLGVLNIQYLLPLFLILTGIFITINYLLQLVGSANQWLALVLGFVLVIPALAFARLYLIKVVEELDTP